ncbi:MAG TPA: hypothetical protein VI138_01355 [Candidatus Dormibacteraeota bacterium]
MPDDYLTVDEVAAQLALPLEMIQRRIESGDIPVHWVEIGGKLEMRISADEIGVADSTVESTPFPAPEGLREDESESESGEDAVVPTSWSTREPEYPSDVWTPNSEVPAGLGAPPPTLWEAEPEAEADAADAAEAVEGAPSPEPVWRQDPGGWDDEPLDASAPPGAVTADETEDDVTPELSPFTPTESGSYFPLDEPSADFSAPPPASTPFSAAAELVDEEEDVEEIEADEPSLDLEAPLPSEAMGVPEMVEVPRPSALAAAQGPESAINTIDARELVAGLFERWERALEQRIQAEQRLRFEAELERRLRQVRDLRQELENTRKSTAAQLAEREQEVLALRDRLRDQGQAPKRGGLFRR